MSSGVSTIEIRKLLETDRSWSAYALADLDPHYREVSDWYHHPEALVLVYRGITPPVLFAMGSTSRLEELFPRVPRGRYIYTLLGNCRAILRQHLKIETENHMWRMVLNQDAFPGIPEEGVVKLQMANLADIQTLFSAYPDQPDAFTPEQLQKGIFWGMYEDSELISIAGTHIISQWASVAAIGNVFTRPDRRGRGFATRVTGAVVKDILQQNIRSIVLNTAMDNAPALSCYRKLGFSPYCGYYEGIGTLTNQ